MCYVTYQTQVLGPVCKVWIHWPYPCHLQISVIPWVKHSERGMLCVLSGREVLLSDGQFEEVVGK